MLITPDYQKEQHRLHALARGGYGDNSYNYAYLLAGMALVERCSAVLDYGCGKGSLARSLCAAKIPCAKYDPAIPDCSALPAPADLVACLDVLEHVEPECLSEVLQHVRSLTRKVAFVAIATRPAGKTLSDGRNAHLIIQAGDWWRWQMERHRFEIRRVWSTGAEEWVAMMRPV